MVERWRRAWTEPLAPTIALVLGAIVAVGLGGPPLLAWGCLAGAAGHALSGSV
jgi:hypothetical protein